MKYPVRMIVDGEERRAEVEARTLLADFLREGLGIARVRIACADGGCGACAVLVDGRLVRSCTLLALQADGALVVTAEGSVRSQVEGGGAPGSARDGTAD